MFFPPRTGNEFNLERYILAVESGEFRDLFNLGVCEAGGGTWLLKDFVQEPNAFFSGNMGSGKSMGAAYTAATWMMTNSDQTIMFIADAVKGGQDYASLYKFDNVYPINSEGGRNAEALIERVIHMVFSETMARRDLFNELGVISIKDYEKKTGKSMARVIVILEEFHSIPNILDYEKNFKKLHTTANKLHQLMKLGRSFGVFFIAASQRSTSSDVPPSIVGNFTQKMIFKVTLGEANYVLGRSEPAYLTSAQKGRCYTDYGAVQFPYLPRGTQDVLLQRYYKPLSAECVYLNHNLIKDYLDGKSTKELYQLKKMTELAEALESFEGELVLQIIHDKLGDEIEKLDWKTDNYGACMIVTNPKGERQVVMYKADAKIGIKTLNNLAQAIQHYQCSGAILYCLGENLTQSIYSSANELGIRILDHEDIKLISRQIDAGKIQVARNLEVELANTNENPFKKEEQKKRQKKEKKPAPEEFEKEEQEPSLFSEDSALEDRYVDPNNLNLALLGDDDPAVLKALRASQRLKKS